MVCLDETSKQVIAETRTPVPAKPGQPGRYDCEYERNGPANLFMMFAPLEGWRFVKAPAVPAPRFTPKHGSWLDTAEPELGVLSFKCLDRRIADKQTLAGEIAAWEATATSIAPRADWPFTTAKARVKPKQLPLALNSPGH
ncbi:MAG: hypothetical protein M3Z96_10110 [Pseudomonadota bacterium]|nr:hypothetical protein [Pseudomonadota bacterium]